jgi:hypothetical protein
VGDGLEGVMDGGSDVRTTRYMVEEGDEEEEEVLPLVRLERRSKACSNTSNLADVMAMDTRDPIPDGCLIH